MFQLLYHRHAILILFRFLFKALSSYIYLFLFLTEFFPSSAFECYLGVVLVFSIGLMSSWSQHS